MANTKPIKWLRDILGNKFFPVTHMKAVRDDDGNTLSCALTNINEQISTKQDTLVSDTNIKTVNGNSLLGSGDVDVNPKYAGAISMDPNSKQLYLKTDRNERVDNIVTDGDPEGAAAHASRTSVATVSYIGEQLNTKYTKPLTGIPKTDLTSDVQTSLGKADTSVQKVTSTDNAVVRFDSTTGNIQNSGVTINDSNQVTAAKFITSGGTSSQFVKGDGSLDSTTYLSSTNAYWANLQVETAANYITEPEIKSLKINGSSTNAASTQNAVIQYDTTNKCIKFVFN